MGFGLRNTFSSFTKNARLWLVSGLFAGLGWSVWSVLFPLYLVQLGYREELIGTYNSASAITMALAAVPMGVWLRTKGRKAPLLAANLGGLLFGCVQVASPYELHLIVTSALFGVFQAMFFVVESPFLMDSSTPEERSQLFSLNFVCFFSMFVVGSLAAGYLPSASARLLSVGAESVAAFRCSLVLALMLRLMSSLPLFLMKETRQETTDTQPVLSSSALPSARSVSKLCFARLFFALGSGFVMPFIPVLLRTRLDAGTQVIGAITALTNLGVTLGCLAAPYIEKRLGIMRAISLSILLAAPLVLIVGTSPVLVIVAVAVIFREALPQTTAPLRQKFSMEVVTHRERSIMASLEQLFWQAPWALGAWLGGRLIGVYGYATVFAGAALCYALSGVSYAVLFGRESAKLKEGVELGQPVG